MVQLDRGKKNKNKIIKKELYVNDNSQDNNVYDEIDDFIYNKDYVSLIDHDDSYLTNKPSSDIEISDNEYDLHNEISNDMKYENDISEYSEHDDSSDVTIITSSKKTYEINENKLIGVKAWGKNSSVYYDHDLQDIDMMQNDEDAQAVAMLEEKECDAFRERLLNYLTDEDFNYIFQYDQTIDATNNKNNTDIDEKSINSDQILSMTTSQLIDYIKNHYPLILKLLYLHKKLRNDAEVMKIQLDSVDNKKFKGNHSRKEHKFLASFYSTKLTIIHEIILHIYFALLVYPINELKDNKCTSLSNQFVNHHPVFGKIITLLSYLKSIENRELNKVVEELVNVNVSNKSKKNTGINLLPDNIAENANDNDDDLLLKDLITNEDFSVKNLQPSHNESLNYYYKLKEIANIKKKNKIKINKPTSIAEEDDEDRKITKEMEKNRGLVKKSKREYKNPRVKHKLKYKKALKRRRGQVRPLRNLTSKYEGEARGINAKVVHSVKLK